jgi:6-phosphogluconolactonase
MSAALDWHDYPTLADASAALAREVGARLSETIALRGRASLAVPGGRTPEHFLRALGATALDWPRIGLTQSDERWPNGNAARSNAGLIERTLFAGGARPEPWVPLRGHRASPEADLPELEAALRGLAWPLDVAVIGMGEDGHVASLFPNAPGLERALAPPSQERVAATFPAGLEPRITLTAPALCSARSLYLLIAGAGKREALERAFADGAGGAALPVRRVLAGSSSAAVYFGAEEGP